MYNFFLLIEVVDFLFVNHKVFNNCQLYIVHCQFEYGGVAQLGERLPCTQEVIGSIPIISTRLVVRHLSLVARGTG
jgi:hypothetical protein